MTVEELRKIPFLSAVPPDELQPWAATAQPFRVQRRSNLVTAGDDASMLYLVSAGMVVLCLETREGEMRMSGLVGPGQCVGLECLHPTARATHYVCALTDVEGAAVPAAAAREATVRGGDLSRLLAGYAAGRLAELTDDYVRSTTLDVRARAAVALLRVSDSLGDRSVPLTQEQVASLVGTRRETLALVLGRMRRERLIATRYRAIHIVDREGLEEAAQGGYPTCMELGIAYPLTGASVL